MRSVYIKYNPYTVMTEVKIDGEPVKENSELNIKSEERLQMWVENLPQILMKECNTKDFELKFHGTTLDYEDVVSVAEAAKNDGINIRCEHIPAKEVKDKEETISEIFRDIQAGPFEELKQKDVVNAFEMAKSEEFPVNVVATMSAGKSTLINALLNKKLMPSKQEACTAIITEIKDTDNKNFSATVYNNEGEVMETHSSLTLEKMEQLNSNPEVSLIRTEGDIPFVDSRDTALVLVDTPGPNNSRTQEHRKTTYATLKKSAKTLVLYVMKANGLEGDDDTLLSYVAESMKVGGKQSKERFMFVVNQMDGFKEEDDSVESALKNVREYLERKGIINPNIYPASALSALDIRMLLNGSHPNESSIRRTRFEAGEFNYNEELHLEKYAPLPPSVRENINEMLEEARKNGDENREALIHTGIIPIEAAIKMYVEKYAKTAKIKSIVDTFDKKLESAQTFENTKQAIAQNQDKRDEISALIQGLKKKIDDGENAKAFKQKIMDINYDEEIKKLNNGITEKAQRKIYGQSDRYKARGKISKDEAKSICSSLIKFSKDLQAEVQVELENAVTLHMKKSAEALLKQYEKKLASLVQDISVGDIVINPLELIKGDINSLGNTENLINQLTKRELVEKGHWVSDKRNFFDFLIFWRLFKPKRHRTEDKYEDRIDSADLVQKFFEPIEIQFHDNVKNAVEYAKKQVDEIKKIFIVKFDELDKIVANKMTELEKYTSDDENIKKLLDETNKKLEWLEGIQTRIKSILDI